MGMHGNHGWSGRSFARVHKIVREDQHKSITHGSARERLAQPSKVLPACDAHRRNIRVVEAQNIPARLRGTGSNKHSPQRVWRQDEHDAPHTGARPVAERNSSLQHDVRRTEFGADRHGTIAAFAG